MEIVESHDKHSERYKNRKQSMCPVILSISLSSYKEEDAGEKCKEYIGNICKFSALVFLEGEIYRKLEIVIEPTLLAKISAKVLVL